MSVKNSTDSDEVKIYRWALDQLSDLSDVKVDEEKNIQETEEISWTENSLADDELAFSPVPPGAIVTSMDAVYLEGKVNAELPLRQKGDLPATQVKKEDKPPVLKRTYSSPPKSGKQWKVLTKLLNGFGFTTIRDTDSTQEQKTVTKQGRSRTFSISVPHPFGNFSPSRFSSKPPKEFREPTPLSRSVSIEQKNLAPEKGELRSSPKNTSSSTPDFLSGTVHSSNPLIGILGFSPFSKNRPAEEAADLLQALIAESSENPFVVTQQFIALFTQLPTSRFKGFKQKEIVQRAYEVLACLSDQKNSFSIVSEVCKNKNDIIAIVAALIYERHKKKGDLLDCVHTFTAYETALEQENVVFRGTSLSEELNRLYTHQIFHELFEAVYSRIQTELARSDLTKLCLNRVQLEDHLASKNQSGDIRAKADDSLKANVAHFITFAKPLLQYIYNLQLPEEGIKLLTLRRAVFAEYFENSHTLVGELFFLKSLNSFLAGYPDADPWKKSPMTTFSKILQNIANGLLFGVGTNSNSSIPFNGKTDPIFEQFNALIEEFIPIHNCFIDKYTKQVFEL